MMWQLLVGVVDPCSMFMLESSSFEYVHGTIRQWLR